MLTIIIPLIITITIGIFGYLIYRLIVFDYLCNRSVNSTLHEYDSKKKLGIDHETLDSVLEDLENKKLMRVEQKQVLFGPEIELQPTEIGLTKYFS